MQLTSLQKRVRRLTVHRFNKFPQADEEGSSFTSTVILIGKTAYSSNFSTSEPIGVASLHLALSKRLERPPSKLGVRESLMSWRPLASRTMNRFFNHGEIWPSPSRANRPLSTGAEITYANVASGYLGGARWPGDARVPRGWQRDTDSGRLKWIDTNGGRHDNRSFQRSGHPSIRDERANEPCSAARPG